MGNLKETFAKENCCCLQQLNLFAQLSKVYSPTSWDMMGKILLIVEWVQRSKGIAQWKQFNYCEYFIYIQDVSLSSSSFWTDIYRVSNNPCPIHSYKSQQLIKQNYYTPCNIIIGLHEMYLFWHEKNPPSEDYLGFHELTPPFQEYLCFHERNSPTEDYLGFH